MSGIAKIAAMAAAIAAATSAGFAAGLSIDAGYGAGLWVGDTGASIKPRFADGNWQFRSPSEGYAPDADGWRRFTIADGEGEIVTGRAKFSFENGTVRAEWEFEARRDCDCNALFLNVYLPCAAYAGGELAFGGEVCGLPLDQREEYRLGEKQAETVEVRPPTGPVWALALDRPRKVFVQDGRRWTNRDAEFSARVIIREGRIEVGERMGASLILSAECGVAELRTGPVVVSEGPDWIPVRDSTDIVPGSALDFSALGWLDAPAGKHGRIVAKGEHFEFDGMPGVPQRFYGVNLCFGANFPETREKAEEVASRLARLGYNALRIHHHGPQITESSSDGTEINPKRMAQLDDLAAACIEKGIYLTTDIYVSRKPFWRALGIDRDGRCPPGQYKDLCLFHDGAYSNLCAFALQFLGHVNPRTGRRWADEPALAWLSVINEGNPGTRRGFANFAESPVAVAKWRTWLAEKKKSEPSAYGDVAEEIPRNAVEKSKQCRAFATFLADLQRDFDRRFFAFLRDEIGCKALLTDMNGGYSPVEYQRVRAGYDYVDMHFYVDHPKYINDNFRIPSQCANVNPVRDEGYTGFARTVGTRLLDRPFTLTEFNFAAPSRWRGVGGLMLGVQAALHDYGAVWRFAWSHDAVGLLDPVPLAYFDAARDPLMLATERAALCLYMRRDAAPLARTMPIMVPDGKDDNSLSRGGLEEFGSLWFGWHSRIGTLVGDEAPTGSFGSFAHPGFGSVNDANLIAMLGDAKPGDGQVSIDRERGFFGVSTPRTCGFVCEGGKAESGSLEADVSLAPCTVWASSLDGLPLERSRRILVHHLTELQDEGLTFADAGSRTLVKWGTLPHLMRRGCAEISLRADGMAEGGAKVYALAANGERRGEVPASTANGRISFIADTALDSDDATFAYEIVRESY